MADLHSVCEQIFEKRKNEIRRIGFNSSDIRSLVEKDYPSLDRESVSRCADVIQLMLINNEDYDSISA